MLIQHGPWVRGASHTPALVSPGRELEHAPQGTASCWAEPGESRVTQRQDEETEEGGLRAAVPAWHCSRSHPRRHDPSPPSTVCIPSPETHFLSHTHKAGLCGRRITMGAWFPGGSTS